MVVAFKRNVLEGPAELSRSNATRARQVVGCVSQATAIRSGDEYSLASVVPASGRSLHRGLHTHAVPACGDGVTSTALAVFLLACFGLVEVVAVGRIFARVRAWLLVGWTAPLGRLVHCPMCLGVWVGAGFAAVGLFPLGAPRWLEISTGAFASSAWCWSAHVVLARLGAGDL